MAIVTRYFSTTSAGAGDGTTWADRAALFASGAWSTIITGFSFAGSDSLVALVGPGTYAITAVLPTLTPTAANSFTLHGCDASGNYLASPADGWVSSQPDFDDSTLPVLATTTNIATLGQLQNSVIRCLKFTATANTGAISGQWGGMTIDSCVFTNAAGGVLNDNQAAKVTNTILKTTSATYDYIASIAGTGIFDNVRLVGNAAASSGSRIGLRLNAGSNIATASRCTSINNQSHGFSNASTSSLNTALLFSCLAYGNTGSGFASSSAAQKGLLRGCVSVANGAYGFDAGSSSFDVLNCRMRDNTSGNINGNANQQSATSIFAAGTDAAEFVDVAGGDYRIKSTSDYWGLGLGPGDELASGGGGTFPTAAQVLDAVVFGPTDNLTGTVVLPAVGNVRNAITFGPSSGSTGTLALPSAGAVLSSVSYGTGGTELTGTFANVAVSSVVLGVQYGAGGTEFTGTVRVPTAAQVLSGVSFGAADAISGTVALPTAGQVLSTVTFGPGSATSGTYVVVAASDVRAGVTFGPASASTGTLLVSGISFDPAYDAVAF